MNSRYFTAIAALLVVLNLFLLITLVGRTRPEKSDPRVASEQNAGYEQSSKFTLYVGLADKDTGSQIIATRDAKTRLNAIAARHADGFTVVEGDGYWRDDSGVPVGERTLIYLFYDATDEQSAAVAGEMAAAMNQSAILIEKGGALRRFQEYPQPKSVANP